MAKDKLIDQKRLIELIDGEAPKNAHEQKIVDDIKKLEKKNIIPDVPFMDF